MAHVKKYTIKQTSELSGLNPILIRAWQRRYNLVEPNRSRSNRRQFTGEEIERLRLFGKATLAGYRIGNIKDMTNDQLRELIDNPLRKFEYSEQEDTKKKYSRRSDEQIEQDKREYEAIKAAEKIKL